MSFLPCCSADTVAEWLRRWTANPMCSARVGSNPIGVVLFLPSPNLFSGQRPRGAVHHLWPLDDLDDYADFDLRAHCQKGFVWSLQKNGPLNPRRLTVSLSFNFLCLSVNKTKKNL